MEFLVEFDINVPDGTPGSEVAERQTAEASAAAKLADADVGDQRGLHAGGAVAASAVAY